MVEVLKFELPWPSDWIREDDLAVLSSLDGLVLRQWPRENTHVTVSCRLT